MPDGSTTPLTDTALTPDPGVRTITSGGAINGSIPAGHDSPSRLGIPHAPPEIADRLLAEGAVIRRAARATLVAERQIALGQYFTPMWVARLMAAMCETNGQSVRVLDPGAGAGTLFAARGPHVGPGGRSPFALDHRVRTRSRAPAVPGAERAGRSPGERGMPGALRHRAEAGGFRRMGYAVRARRPVFGAPKIRRGHIEPALQEAERRVRPAKTLDQLGIAAPNLYAAFLGLAVGASGRVVSSSRSFRGAFATAPISSGFAVTCWIPPRLTASTSS